MVKVRFAPSPSGSLHIGSARTAIVNYLFARSNQGKLLLRIEDTDFARSTQESKKTILSTLQWLGIDWDEGPFYQSDRFILYQKYATSLLESGKAYRCFCTPDELNKAKDKKEEEDLLFAYQGKCRYLSEMDIQKNLEQQVPFVIRLKMPENEIAFTDTLKGRVSFQGSLLSDIVIARSDGSPTYNFAVVVDDYLMEITHVIRGEDHLSNTPKQIAIYQALGWEIPHFCHLPLILGPDKSKLSKRHCDTAIEDYQKAGYLPDAIFCYLALLGYSRNPSKKIFFRESLIDDFQLDKLSNSPSQFDLTNLIWMNQQFIKTLDDDTLWNLSHQWLESIELDLEKKKKIVVLSRNQIKILSETPSLFDPFLTYCLQINSEQAKKLVMADDFLPMIEVFFQKIVALSSFDVSTLEKALDEVIEDSHLDKKRLIQIIRIIVTGSLVSPPIFDTLLLIGKSEIKKRFDQFKREIKND